MADPPIRLLFDENLSVRLVYTLARTFPGSAHVDAVDLTGKRDEEIWAYASRFGFVIATKGQDFVRLSALLGPVPKVVWVRRGNCGTEEVARLLTERHQLIQEFVRDNEARFLVLS